MPKSSPARAATSSPNASIRVGVGGWVYAPWRDNFYPKGLVQRLELEYASRRLTAIEINGTYYHAQQPETYARWANETPEGFVFSLKAPMRITKARALDKVGAHVADFLGGALSLGDRLGPVVWQFEPGARLDRDAFGSFVESLPHSLNGISLRHVLDVRVPGFVDTAYVTLARRNGIATVFTDSDEHPSFADITADFVYARLMRARSAIATGYRAPELAAWAERLREWAKGDEPQDLPRLDPTHAAPKQPRDVFAFFINADKERNPAAAMALIERINAL